MFLEKYYTKKKKIFKLNHNLSICKEPTTGLDSGNALIVIKLLKKLINNGRTVGKNILLHSYIEKYYKNIDKSSLILRKYLFYQKILLKKIDLKGKIYKYF